MGMHEWLQGVASSYIGDHAGPEGAPFKFGFHAVPSMKQLHMHVISQVCRGAYNSVMTMCGCARRYACSIAACSMSAN
jgi:Scavenger mRNA decapping enzyme C-term binding